MMTRNVRTMMAACAVWLAAFGTLAMAQGAPPKPAEKPIIPLKVTLTLSRYDGDKKIENLPFSFLVNANGGPLTSNNAAQVPVPDSSTAAGAAVVSGSFSYKPLGTNLTLSAESLDDARFSVSLTISDSSSSPTKTPGTPLPVFRSFSISNKVVLRDGQTAEFVSSTDKVTGEVTKAVLGLAVVK